MERAQLCRVLSVFAKICVAVVVVGSVLSVLPGDGLFSNERARSEDCSFSCGV